MDVTPFFRPICLVGRSLFHSSAPIFGGSPRPYGLSFALRRRRKPSGILAKGFPVPVLLFAPKGSGASRPLARLLASYRALVISQF